MRGITDYLKVEELKDGYLYRINARNADYGIWYGEKGAFIISRTKFYDNYLFEEIHWDLSEDFGTVKPIEEVEKSPFKVEDIYTMGADVLKYLNKLKNR